MTSTTKDHNNICMGCGSRLIHLEWEERLDPHQLQQLWRCLKCRNEFITFHPSEEKSTAGAEIMEPIFANLVVE